MSSINEGYNYDIFISYRQKDNKHDGWVTDFVSNLKGELEATFKEDISVYFDSNPHDGLLETHDVKASLGDKLKCLVFIPVISRTYCDPKSFAWENEFKTFLEQASNDKFGLKVKLNKGNVASRVLPVIIHDLDIEDIKLCETVLGGVLRGVEFIYKSPGVNRPLRSTEDKPHDNLSKTIYLDQINKVANAVKEIISSLKSEQDDPGNEKEVNVYQLAEAKGEKINNKTGKTLKPTKRQMVTGSLILIAFVALLTSYMIFSKKNSLNNSGEEILKKAIAFCDFYNRWDDYYGKVRLRTVYEDGTHSDEVLEIQTKENFYYRSYNSGNRGFTESIKDGKCFHKRVGEGNPVAEEIKNDSPQYRDIQFIKEHHYCHFGLLMELEASGMVLQNKVEIEKFNGSKCIAVTFKGDSTTAKNAYFSGIDNYVVYIDPANYSMKGTKVSGKFNYYTVFSGTLNVNDIKIPLCKTYFNDTDNSLKWIDVFSIAE
jgi:hypothetical protein